MNQAGAGDVNNEPGEAPSGQGGASADGESVMAELEVVLGLRAFVESVNDTIFLSRADGVITYVSPNWAELVGEPPSAPLGRSFADYIHPEDIAACQAHIEAMARLEQKPSSITYRVRHADGGWRWHEARLARFQLEGGAR